MVVHFISFRVFTKMARTRIFKLAISLILAIGLFSFIFWQVEKEYRNNDPLDKNEQQIKKKEISEGCKSFSYLNALENIAIFTISGFDTDPPKTPIGWTSAIISLILGIVLVGAFTAEIASIFVESRLRKHSAVSKVDFSDHIIVCGTLSDPKNFFTQLYHPDHGQMGLKVVFLMPHGPSPQVENFIGSRKFKGKVKYVIGSPLIQEDLEKARANYAKAAFIFANRFAQDKNEEDAKTILRSLAIEAYNKNIETYVQLLNCQNKQHLAATGADNYLSLDELSLNLMSHACLNPGLSDLIVNLVNSSGDELGDDVPAWQKEYNYGAGQEIYRVPTGKAFLGKTFAEAAARIYHQLGIAAIAVERPKTEDEYNFAVNPGKDWVLTKGDSLFVIADDYNEAKVISSINKEMELPQEQVSAAGSSSGESGWKGSPVPQQSAQLKQVTFDGHIIICGRSSDLLTLIKPLRSPHLKNFKRIVILNPEPLSETHWEMLEKYNEIYYVQGSPLAFEDLKRAGIMKTDKAIILSTMRNLDAGDEVMVDADTIMTVMSIENLQEEVYTIAELAYASNIKFLKPQIAEQGGGYNRFSADEVITISRIADSLICQSYFTPHLPDIFDELFSVDEDCSDDKRNTCEIYQVKLPGLFQGKQYGSLFQYLSNGLGIVPIGLYRKSPENEYYVFTNPPADTILKSDDFVYVLAPDEPEL